MEFFNNKENDILKFKINSDGINVNDVEPRLILMTKENKNVLLIGKIENDICRFEIPQLSLYEKGDNGRIKFEIISEDLYFPVWQDNFEIKSKASIKIEEMVSEIQKSSINKPRISVSETNFENKPILEKKVVEKVVEKEEKIDTISKLESVFENKITIIEEEDDDDIILESETPTENEISKEVEKVVSSIMKFDSFSK